MPDNDRYIYDEKGRYRGQVSSLHPFLRFLIKAGIVIFLLIAVFVGPTVYRYLNPPPGYTDLKFSGPLTHTFNPHRKRLVLEIDKLGNAGTGKSENLKIAAWACDAPQDSGDITGIQIAELDLKDTLRAGYFYRPTTRTLKVTTLPPFEQPKTIVVAVLEKDKTDDKYTIEDFRNLDGTYVFHRNEWLKWWVRMPMIGWIGIGSGFLLLLVLGVCFAYRKPRNVETPT